MARKKAKPMHEHPRKGVLVLGFLIFLFGALRYYGFDTNTALMIVGALLFLKGLIWYKK
jgi:hypothetical protein